jgi:hypothetical protein
MALSGAVLRPILPMQSAPAEYDAVVGTAAVSTQTMTPMMVMPQLYSYRLVLRHSYQLVLRPLRLLG